MLITYGVFGIFADLALAIHIVMIFAGLVLLQATLTLPGIAGIVLTWARALGEFGATITFAGNSPGSTQTLPLAIYSSLESGNDTAVSLSFLMMAISFVVLISLRQHWMTAFQRCTS
jgi:molybdate transport system permease protein